MNVGAKAAREGSAEGATCGMAWRSRGRGLTLWAAILAVYALLLHAPAMAVMGHSDDGTATAAAVHDHGDQASTAGEHEQSSADNTCCTVCAGGPCAIGPVGTGGIALPLPLARARRFRPAVRRHALRENRSSWFEARGPPSAG